MSFDRLAPHYRWLEAILAGDKLQECRVAWLDQTAHCRRALLIGEGNGRFLTVCAAKMPHAHFTVVDASGAMLRRAKKNWLRAGGGLERADFVEATLPGLKLAGDFDLIATHYFLDCFPDDELPQVIEEIAALAAPGANWLMADFAVPAQGWARWRARAILWLAYLFFRWTTSLHAKSLASPDKRLQASGFKRVNRLERDWGLLHSDLWVRV